MSRAVGCLFIVLLLVSCAGNRSSMPVLQPLQESEVSCQPIFPQGSFQFVHHIEFSMAGGVHGSAVGVTVIRDKSIESALMTVEGFILFAATLNNKLTVSRAVPPFDKPGFAAGMMRDIRAIFLHPVGKQQWGTLNDGTPVCRISEENGQVTDSFRNSRFCRQRNIYNRAEDGNLQLNRRLTGQNCSTLLAGTAVPVRLDLSSRESGGYTLQMTLISAEELP